MESQWSIGDLLGVSSAYWKGCALQAAVRLDIFSCIHTSNLTSDEVATRIYADNRATEMLLDALAAMKLLEKKDFRYTNSNFAKTFLTTQSPQYMGHILLHHHHILDGWAQLDKAVTTGAPIEKRSYGEETERQSFLMGMFNLAMGVAPQIADQLDLHGKKRLLDLGGGPGTYAIHFCLSNPELQATIFDRPTTKPFAEQTVDSFNLADRINFKSGDFTTDSITGGPYDIAWLSHILHSNGPDECQTVLHNTVSQMEKGGIIFIHDFILNDNKDAPEFAALFSLNMLINNPRGRAYSESEIRAMMHIADISAIERHPFVGPNDSGIIFGVV
ncbi:MAG: methyltransferase [Desulfocapsaceae bacterium]|nr:methyltransferase [Desulfocapsaceae bacterium]